MTDTQCTVCTVHSLLYQLRKGSDVARARTHVLYTYLLLLYCLQDFDPLNLSPKDSEGFVTMRTKEINNGR